mmetsp:Transcript_27388/g.52161  ORF Transcript_27388/g.52161 Transcript_27388/m.52161 type:complete len:207 (-) Transcript_27388:1222-1842(-)
MRPTILFFNVSTITMVYTLAPKGTFGRICRRAAEGTKLSIMGPVLTLPLLRNDQGHFRLIKTAPFSSYSILDIHICWKEPREARMEPPMNTLNLRSTSGLGDATFTRAVYEDTWSESSRSRRSLRLGMSETPPVTSTPEYSSLRTSTSQRPMASNTRPCRPFIGVLSSPMRFCVLGKVLISSGWNSSSGILKRSSPTSKVLPSGSS